ncbi:alpha-galactosidase, partial [Streptomyces populi]
MRANASSVLDAGAGPVEIHGPTGTVLLNTAHSAYVFRVDRTAGTVRHVHWGLSIPLADAVALPLWSENDNSFAGPLDGTEEYPFEGGARFAAPAFEVRFGDGSSPVEPTVQDPILLEDNHVVVPVQDRCRPLAWRLHYRVPAGGDVVQRWVDFVHTGTEDDGDILLVRGASAHWPVPQRPHWRMSTVYGSWSAESRLHRSTLPIGETTLGSRRGHTGHHANPWIAVDPGDTGEEHGEVWLVALAASGSWRITAQRTAAGRTGILASEGHEAAELLLRPGQQHRTPVSLAQYTTGGFGTASRSIHRHLRTHVLPHPSELRPVLYNSWEATSFEVNEDNQIALARRAAALGVELFVLDDGWFRGRDDDRSGLGDWTPHPRKFPRGLRPLADEVHRLGMKFGLWVEPEMVNVNSDLYRAHPEWLLHIPDRTSTELRHQLVLDFSRQEVTDWALQRLCRLVRENHVDFLKWDFNRSFT